MRCLLVLALLSSVFQVGSTEAVVFCDDVNGKYTANSGNLALNTFEFPIMATNPPGSAGVSGITPKLIHPCYSLNSDNNYKNQLYDIFKYGKFVKDTCRRSCVHFVDAARLYCGDRRPPPSWQTGSISGANRKINCSNWDIPLTRKGKEEGIGFTFQYATYAANSGIDIDPPYTLNTKSIEYLDSIPITGLHLNPIIENSKLANATIDLEELLLNMITRHPEIVHLAYGNPIAFFGDSYRNVSKYYAPLLRPTGKFWSGLATIPTLNSLSLARIVMNGNESTVTGILKHLKAVSFLSVSMRVIPSWIDKKTLQFIEFRETLTDEMDKTVLDELPELEHFILKESKLTTIKAPFLASSANILSLTLQCNMIKSIEEHAFDHMTELKFLNIAGNRITTLPDTIFSSLSNILVLDVKTVENKASIITYDEVTIQCQAGSSNLSNFFMEKVPNVPHPEKIMALDVRGQKNFLKDKVQPLKQFKKLEILSIGNIDLHSVSNLSIETLCNLEDLNIMDNILDDNEWINDDIFINVNLQRLRIGSPPEMKTIPNSVIAFMRTASQVLYSLPLSLRNMDFYKTTTGCVFDTVSTATYYGYQIQNQSCSEHVQTSLTAVRNLEMVKMETECT